MGYTDSCQCEFPISCYLRMQTYVSAATLLAYIPTLSHSLPSLCNWMQWEFFSSERHWRMFDMHSFKVWAWGSGTLEPDFQTTTVSVHATCSFSLVAHQDHLLIFFQSHLVCQYLVWQVVFNQANWGGVRRLQAAFFPSYVIYFTSLTWPSDLF